MSKNVEDIVKALRDLLVENDQFGGCPSSSPAWEEARQALSLYAAHDLLEASRYAIFSLAASTIAKHLTNGTYDEAVENAYGDICAAIAKARGESQ